MMDLERLSAFFIVSFSETLLLPPPSSSIVPNPFTPHYLSGLHGVYLSINQSTTKPSRHQHLPLRRIPNPRKERRVRHSLHELNHRPRSRIPQPSTERAILSVPNDPRSRQWINGPTVHKEPLAHQAGYLARRWRIDPRQFVRGESCNLLLGPFC